MTSNQIKQAIKMAQNRDLDLSQIDDSVLHGCGLPDFKPVTVTLSEVAKLLKWQCCQLNGGFDYNELNENMIPIMKRNIRIV